MSETLRIKREQATLAETVAEKRRLLEDGTMFARFTIRQRTAQAEAGFASWKAAGRPSELPPDVKYLRTAIQQTLDSLRALSDADVTAIFDYEIHASEALLGSLIKGISSPKTSFSLACAGIGRRGCIDSHIVQDNFEVIGDLLSKQARETKTSRDWVEHKYQTACDRLWDADADTAAQQWEVWLASPKSNPSGTDHEVLR